MPSISPHPRTGFEFPTLNKPYSLLKFVESDLGKALSDSHEIMLTDPDTLFIDELPFGISQLGRPMSARYSLGRNWLDNRNITDVCGEACDELKALSFDELGEEWTSGPPIFVRMADLRRLVVHWFELTEKYALMSTGNVNSVPGGW